jgi:MFS-type transporter involved in bile tolerance (Atg22 family)
LTQPPLFNKKVIAWAFYDWANSAFALSVLAVLFPLFLGSYWSAGDPGAAVTARLAWITAASSAVVCIIAPVFGTIADAGGYRKRFLFLLAMMGAVATAVLAGVDKGNWPVALGLYLVASVGFYSSTVFYDSLIIDVTEPRYYSFVSSLGFSLGYLGGALLLALHVWMLLSPEMFGFSTTDEVIRFAFVTVGLWWGIFMFPLMIFVPEQHSRVEVAGGAIRAAYRELRTTLLKIGQYRNVVIFLIAYWLYIGGVFTVIFMAVNYGQRLGFSQQDLVKLGDLHGRCQAVLHHGYHHRLCAGRRAGTEPVLVCRADTTGGAGRVFRVLQHADQIRPRARPDPCRHRGDPFGRSEMGVARAHAIVYRRRHVAGGRARKAGDTRRVGVLPETRFA